ncbi:hypothetical protein AYL99_05635 [Fonsecaea erecta]|uniref:DNA polymerase lambda n=1 Tax=Fonsecaea erecta TaxID=1367422 RepID=A0A178ZN65_9EURO|nr:hypothetical protein AYL99_05635 [Fonsecaea erecta]OAP60633.1 hypothetical protein AYL99_05635 [Fonsecaea erecta]
MRSIPPDQQIFKGLVFFFVPNNDDDSGTRIRIHQAIQFGAQWAHEFWEEVTHIIVTQDDLDKTGVAKCFPSKQIPKGPTLLRQRWLLECWRSGFLVETHWARFQVAGSDIVPETGCGHVPPIINNGRITHGSKVDRPLANASETSSGIKLQRVSGRETKDLKPEPRGKVDHDALEIAIRDVQKGVDPPPDFDSDEDSGNGDGLVSRSRLEQKRSNEKAPKKNAGFLCMERHDGGSRSENANAETMEKLQKMATSYDQTGDQWRTRAFRQAIGKLRRQGQMIRTSHQARAIGIGESIAVQIEEIVSTGKYKRLQYAQNDPRNQIIKLFMGVYGAGETTAKKWIAQGYRSLDDVYQKGELTANQRVGIEHYEDFQQRIPRGEVEQHAAIVEKALKAADPNFQLIIGGSYRRGSKDSGDIDCIIFMPEAGISHIRTLMLHNVIPGLMAQGFLKVALAGGHHPNDDSSKWHGASALPGCDIWRRIDFLFVPWTELGAAQGSAESLIMGRRPNPLMAEFFERGSKIGDASNRYQQTCRRCGELFSRGRSEAMVSHLTKKCPAISNSERAKIILRLHDLVLPDVHPYIDPTFNPETSENDERATGQEKSGNTVGLPLSRSRQNFDGLNVLAEASRRVDINARGNAVSIPEDPNGQHDQILRPQEDAALDPQLQAGAYAHPLLHGDGTDVQDNAFPTSTPESLPSLYHYIGNLPPAPQGGLAGLPLVSTHPQDLSTIAATANATIDNGSIMPTDLDMSDDVPSALLGGLNENGFPSQGRQRFPWPAMLGTQPMEPLSIPTPTQPIHATDLVPISSRTTDGLPSQNVVSTSQHLRPLAMNPNGRPSQLSDNAEAPKPKVRGRFAPDRRKEVRLLRKVGACLRCRMLKKTCSQETPCQTCAAIESPRLWKNTCMRTRLNDAFPLYFVQLHGVLAYREMNTLKTRVALTPLAGKIDCFHFADKKLVLKGLQGEYTGPAPVGDGTQQPSDTEVVIVAELDTDGLLPKVERYLHATAPKLVDQEQSPVMQASLQIAQIIQQLQQSSVPVDKQDNLVSDVIELWAATSMLIDDKLKAQFAINSGLDNERVPVSETTMAASYRVLTLQFRAAIEKRANAVCKSAMNHFEQRVLSRRKSDNFETFLVAFILLNCVERMCWLFRRWDGNREVIHWPLDQQPGFYADRGEALAQTIQMLINLRQLEPKITVDLHSDAIVACNSDDTALAEWLSVAGFNKELVAQFGRAEFDPEDCRSLDGTLSARLLQPQGLAG